MGSSVEAAGLRAALEAYQQAGLGGVEITPIYGVRGLRTACPLPLTAGWRFETARRGARLGLGVDMATGILALRGSLGRHRRRLQDDRARDHA
jgi:hypothetical protein